MIAPRIFDDFLELAIGPALAWLLVLAARAQDSRGWLHAGAPRWRWGLVLAITAVALPLWAEQRLRRPSELVHQERTFFGVLRVWKVGNGASEQRRLYSGTTLHGVQYVAAPRQPTSYFGAQTGIGLALDQREPDVPSSLGVVGLGIGTLAAYGRPGDRVRFYEIDPAVVRLARDDGTFSYLSGSDAAVEVVEGDARISLASERERGELPRFDFLVIDAFSSDSIPIHLLTREALALYLDALAEDGLLAFHVSNRHFDLIPVLARMAADAGLQVLNIENLSLPKHLSEHSSWVFLSRDEARIRSLAGLALERRRSLGHARVAIRVRWSPPLKRSHRGRSGPTTTATSSEPCDR